MSNARAVAIIGQIARVRDPVFVETLGTLRGLTTSSMLAFVTGLFSESAANSTTGWFMLDPDDTTTPDDGQDVIISATGKRWKRLSTNLALLTTLNQQAAVFAAQAGVSAVNASNSAIAAAASQVLAQAAANAAALLSAAVSFATKALMNADLAHAAGSFAFVYADATPANNGLYYKIGASGAGSWSLYLGDRITLLETATANYRAVGNDPIGPGLSNLYYSWLLTLNDPLGRVLGGLHADNSFELDNIIATSKFTTRGFVHAAPALTGGYVRSLEDSAGHVVDGFRYDGVRAVALDRYSIPTHVHPFAAGRFHAEINFIICAGQSLAGGASGVIISSQPYDNIKINLATDLVFFAGFSGGSTPPEPSAMSYTKELLLKENGIAYTDHFYRLCSFNTAVAANNMAQLSPGGSSGAYENGVAGMAKAHTLATAHGRTFAINAIFWTQGEADNGINELTYRAAEASLAESYNTAAKAETGQAHDIAFITYQCCSDVSPNVAVAQWKAAMEHRLIYMACPIYFMPYGDFQHLTAAGEDWMGGYYGLVYKRVVIEGKDWEPLQPTRCVPVGNNIDVYFNRKELVFDTTLMPAQTNSGFSVENAAGVVQAITSLTILEGGRIRIALGSAPTADWAVKYGHNSVTGKAPFVGGGGNLRDRQGDSLVYNGNTMHNWCVIFNWKV
jgi:hypothetical protein